MPRPPSKNSRTLVVKVLVNKKERAELLRKAKAAGYDALATYVRHTALATVPLGMLRSYDPENR